MENLYTAKKSKFRYIWWILFAVVMILIIVGFLNRERIYDWYRGLVYKPTIEMVVIRERLDLTGEGEFLFNAVQPTLSEADDFNQNCQKEESDVAVLGCYRFGNVYVYNVVSAELRGIRELTTAHELLHAKWDRMSDAEREKFSLALTQVFNENRDLLESEIESYDTDERQEELYVRAGTEIKNLPESLERHFAEIFNDQDKIVGFYESYINVFNKIKADMETLKNAIEDLKVQINNKTANYELMANQLETDIASFNNCAGVVGCFASETEFYAKRNELLARQDTLRSMNDEINDLIDEYNEKIDKYNADATESNKLQEMINSNKIPNFN